jgi:hypothetical protein
MNLLSESVEQRQLRILYRQFLFRIIDADLLSANADPEKLLGQIGTVLLSFSVIVSVPVIFAGPAHLPETIARTFEHFFLATTMLVVGLFAVLSWDAVFPARLDVLVLAPLPVRPRTIFLARMSAIAASLGVAVGALNAISGLLWPWIFSPPHSGLLGGLRSLIAYWITLLATAVFVFGATLTLQGTASLLLPRQLFLRVSAALQVAVFCLLISVYVLEPSLESRAAILSPANHTLLAWLPSYWFLALFQQLSGAHVPGFDWLARRAWIAVGTALVGALLTILLSYLRAMRRALEQPDIEPGSHRASWLLSCLGNSVQSAVLLFATRTILRSRQHRLILSFYLGAGFGVMLILLRPAITKGGNPAIPLLASSALMLATAAVAMRSVFSMPIALHANWIFRLAALDPVRRYAAAIRRAFLLLTVVPVWIGFAITFFWLLPRSTFEQIAIPHLVFLALLGSSLADLCLLDFRKIPFTCSYRPGRTNLQFAVAGALVLLPLSLIGAHYEWRWLQTRAGQIIFATALILPAFASRWWTARSTRQVEGMQFEDLEEPPIVSLELGPDSARLWTAAES